MGPLSIFTITIFLENLEVRELKTGQVKWAKSGIGKG